MTQGVLNRNRNLKRPQLFSPLATEFTSPKNITNTSHPVPGFRRPETVTPLSIVSHRPAVQRWHLKFKSQLRKFRNDPYQSGIFRTLTLRNYRNAISVIHTVADVHGLIYANYTAVLPRKTHGTTTRKEDVHRFYKCEYARGSIETTV